MPSFVILGRSKRDIGLLIDFRKARAIVRANTAWIEGTPLEKIDPGQSGYRPGMVLISREWRNIYFLNEREGWTDEQYFDLAQKLMVELSVERP